jgi:uncharacterized surface protein with fasciclin (FAS1) repeats
MPKKIEDTPGATETDQQSSQPKRQVVVKSPQFLESILPFCRFQFATMAPVSIPCDSWYKLFFVWGDIVFSYLKFLLVSPLQTKFALLAALVAGASAFSPAQKPVFSTALFNGPELGAGGMADTRNPDALVHEDPRKSISDAPSFEEYLKMRSGGATAAAPAPAAVAAPAAAAPAAYAPAAPAAPAAGSGGSILDTLATLQGPGQVWGADGIAVGKEESELRGYDNFGKFLDRLKSTGVAAELQGAGPFTVFAPTDPAVDSYEKNFGPFDANVCKLHIVKGTVPSSQVSSADLTTISGQKLVYKRAVRKDFVNDVVIGEKTFGQYNDYPVDVACSNGVIHGISLSMAS